MKLPTNLLMMLELHERVFARGFLLASCVLLQACSDHEMPELKQFVETAYQDEKPIVQQLPDIRLHAALEYTTQQGGDPFTLSNASLAHEPPVQKSHPDIRRRKEPLENFQLGDLKMVGTISQKGVPWVLMKTTQGAVYLAKKGSYMGQSHGKVERIFPLQQRVLLQEMFVDPTGKWRTREVQIAINDE